MGAKLFIMSVISALLFFSCKKADRPDAVSMDRSADQILKDSVYYYFKQYSLWSDAFTADKSAIAAFTAAYNSPSDLLRALKNQTPTHAAYNGGIDRFSYLEKIGYEGLKASAALESTPAYGLYFSIAVVSPDVAYPVVYFVEGGSPAAKAGIRRSDILLGAGQDMDMAIPVSCNAGSCNVIEPARQQQVVNQLLELLKANTIQLRLKHEDDSAFAVTLALQPYKIDPIIKQAVFSYPEKRIGYLALSSFEDLSIEPDDRRRLEAVFDNFENSDIKDIILDLRYNTGGYISSAEFIANKIIGPGADQSLMYKFELNPYLSNRSNWKGHNFDDVYFKRSNRLNLNTVYSMYYAHI
jgi:carboxyl-terminal processing protease